MPLNEASAARSSHRILLAEDDDDLRDGLCQYLSLCGFTVETVTNGAELVNALRPKNGMRGFDLVITDICMSWSNGLQVIEVLRQDGINTPAIVISGYADEAVYRKIKALPGVVFFSKPLDLPQLESTLSELLNTAPVA